MFDDRSDKLVYGCVAFVLTVATCAIIYGLVVQPLVESRKEVELKTCFQQQQKTDDCKYLIWKFENTKR